MEKIKRERRLILLVITLLFTVILIISLKFTDLSYNFKGLEAELRELRITAETQFINETILGQAQRTATALREGFRYFFKAHPYLDIRKVDGQGRIIYRNLAGKSIAFNPQKMILKDNQDFFYNIYNKKGELLLEKARPSWDKKVIKEVLRMTSINNMKMYGPTGDPLIFDPQTGEVILNNSKESATVPEVVRFSNNGAFLFRDIKLDAKHPNAGYPEAMQWVIDHQLTWRRDGSQVYYFTMKDKAIPLEDIKSMKSMDFSKYPLGEYNREFQYQFVLPSETLGLQDTDMQLIVVLSAQEQEIISPYRPVIQQYRRISKNIKQLKQLAIHLPKTITIIAMIIVTIAAFGLRNLYSYVLQKG